MDTQQYGGSIGLLDDIFQIQISSLAPKTIVDFGAGAGKNGKLIREKLGNSCQITAVEGFEKTADMLKTSAIYDVVHHALIQDWLKKNNEHYDIAAFGDVLEHLSVGEIHDTIKTCKKYFRYIIIVVPLYNLTQEEIYGNKLEIHKSYISGNFFDRYFPLEKHIKIWNDWTIMNVIISSSVKKPFYKRCEHNISHFFITLLQPLGLAKLFFTCWCKMKRILYQLWH